MSVILQHQKSYIFQNNQYQDPFSRKKAESFIKLENTVLLKIKWSSLFHLFSSERRNARFDATGADGNEEQTDERNRTLEQNTNN